MLLPSKLRPPARGATKSEATTRAKRKFRPKLWLRTRERETFMIQSLQMDINDLKQEIESLTTLRSILYTRILNEQDEFDNSFVKTVRQYYDFMHDGFHEVMVPRSGGDAVNGRAFMAATMDEEMYWGQKQGLDQFIKMWQGLSKAFDDRYFGMTNARLIREVHFSTADIVVVEAVSAFSVRLGGQSVKYVFPNLAGKPDLLQRVLGRRVEGGGKLRLEFGFKTRRVTRLDMAVNVAEGLFRLVGDAVVLKELLDGSALAPGYVDGHHQVTPPSKVLDDGAFEETFAVDELAEVESEPGLEIEFTAESTVTSVPNVSRMSMDFLLTKDHTAMNA